MLKPCFPMCSHVYFVSHVNFFRKGIDDALTTVNAAKRKKTLFRTTHVCSNETDAMRHAGIFCGEPRTEYRTADVPRFPRKCKLPRSQSRISSCSYIANDTLIMKGMAFWDATHFRRHKNARFCDLVALSRLRYVSAADAACLLRLLVREHRPPTKADPNQTIDMRRNARRW
jgi:hypothetical protein